MFENGYFLLKSKKGKKNEIMADCCDNLWSLPHSLERVSSEEMLKRYEVIECLIDKPKTRKPPPRTEENANQKYQDYEYRVL